MRRKNDAREATVLLAALFLFGTMLPIIGSGGPVFDWDSRSIGSGFRMFAGTSLVAAAANWIFAVAAQALSARRLSRPLKRLHKPPWRLAASLCEFLLPRRLKERVIDQHIADFQIEYCDALVRGRPWKARWLYLRFHVEIVLTLGTLFTTAVVKRATTIWKLISL